MNVFRIIFILTVISFIGCNKNDEKRTTRYPDLTIKEQDELITKAIKSNNDTAYIDICSYYGIYNKSKEFLSIAIEMANKNESGRACNDVYWILTNLNGYKELEKLDKKTKYLALYYLLRSYELGFWGSNGDVDNIFKDKQIPTSNEMLIRMGED